MGSGKTPERVFLQIYEKLSAGKYYSTEEMINVTKSGQEYYMHSTFFPIRENGKNAFYVMITHDITERKKLQDKIQHERAQLKNILSGISKYSIIMMNKDGVLEYANPATLHVRGYLPETIIGEHYNIFCTAAGKKSKTADQLLQHAIEYGYAEDEGWRMKKDGGMYFAQISIAALKDDSNRIIGFAEITHDITEQKRLEASLRESGRLLHEILDTVPLMALILDQSGNITYSNHQFQDLSGYGEDQLIGNNFFELMTPSNKKNFYHNRFKKLLKTAKNRHTESILITKNGYKKHIVWYNVKMHNALGDVSNLLSFGEDITEWEQMESQRNAFISIAGHELRTPLTSMSLYVQMMLKRKPQQIKREEVEAVYRDIQRLTNLVNELLDVSRVDTGKLYLNLERVNVTDLINDVIKRMRSLAGKREITFQFNEKVYVAGDISRLEQVVTNIISNAIKYSDDSTRIQVNQFMKGKDVIISVKDEGFGIPKNMQKKIFDRFERIENKRTDSFGLGLFISKEIIKKHKGKIWLQSKERIGSTFFISLPLFGTH